MAAGKFSIAYLIGEAEGAPEGATAKTELHADLRNVSVHLEGASLWRRFHQLGTEMIVTKSGRRMFPTLQFTVEGMNPTAQYSMMVDFHCVDKKRYRYSFHQSKWVVAGPGDAELSCRLHMHTDSPASGLHWMKQIVGFDRIKLTNNQLDQNGHVIVNSMHRYQPEVHVILQSPCSSSSDDGDFLMQKSFSFPETQFMAVTAYQNHRITELKIECNPFAKGFRECEMDQMALIASAVKMQLNYEQIYPLLFGRKSPI